MNELVSPSLADELNNFYSRFDSPRGAHLPPPSGEEGTFKVMEHDVRCVLSRVNPRKAVGPEGITGRVIKACADQLTPVLTVIFNLSLSQCIIPTYFKQSTIVPMPKKPHTTVH